MLLYAHFVPTRLHPCMHVYMFIVTCTVVHDTAMKTMFFYDVDPPSSSGSGSIVIQLKHQLLHFAQDNITLAWSLFDKDADSDVSQPNLQYSLDIGDCNPQNISANYSVNSKTLVVSSQGLDSNSFINITLPSEDLSIDERFRIKHGG